MTKPSYSRGRLSALLGGAIVCAGALAFGCLERPVVPSKPVTSNVFVQKIQNTAIDKIDLLFVIDNSTSMADKQAILEQAVPEMVTRLVTPDCVTRDDEGNIVGPPTPSTPSGTPGGKPTCAAAGSDLQFSPINDIHIGVITTSLGGHGSEACKRTKNNDNDKAYLLPLAPTTNDAGVPLTDTGVRAAMPTPGSTGFLVWYPVAREGQDPARPIVSDVGELTDAFRAQVVEVGEFGCGFEAPLEAWYRFLVDPSPPAGMALDDKNQAASIGRDDEVIRQRNSFLRGDSLVAIIVLTDENDCSAMEGGQYYPLAQYGWLVSHTSSGGNGGQNYFLPVATAACEDPAKGPNDPCCFSCLLSKAPAACTDASAINACASGEKLAPENDRANVRCFQNKRRFGIDLLYPTDRYVKGLKDGTIVDSQSGETVANPLYKSASGEIRANDLVFFAGIVGIPWQDIATAESLADPAKLKYLTADELTAPTVEVGAAKVDRWTVILGDPKLSATSKICLDKPETAGCGEQPVAPLDPFMIESIVPRTVGATNPIDTNQAITAVGAPGGWNDINGHEYNNGAAKSSVDPTAANDDLQYSCIFPLADYDAVKADCAPENAACDCGIETGTTAKGSPLCQENPTDPAGTSQYYGKAYPATRVLEVLRGFGANSIVASICPKVSDSGNADFGYNPAVGAIVDRLAEKLAGQCLPRGLTVDKNADSPTYNQVPCTIVEALDPTVPGVTPLDCAAPGRTTLKDEIKPAVIKVLQEGKLCDTEGAPACKDFTMCGIQQLAAGTSGGDTCLNDTGDPTIFSEAGYCYVDPSQGIGSEALVKTCSATQKRILRFVGTDTPKPKTITFVACTADAAQVISTPPPAAGGAGN